jgi:hypothetical protein
MINNSSLHRHELNFVFGARINDPEPIKNEQALIPLQSFQFMQKSAVDPVPERARHLWQFCRRSCY